MFPSLTLCSFRQAGASRPKDQSSSELPLYSAITTDHLDHTFVSPNASSATDSDLSFSDTDADHLFPTDSLSSAQHHPHSLSFSSTWLSRPSLSRFLADFTLGFADGLTVPFALTAGLSSLGKTDTVIYAGMAEICAGSISMGIGGYLSAKGEDQGACEPITTITIADAEADTDAEEKTGCTAVVEDYLAPLDLPSELLNTVRQHVFPRSDITSTLAQRSVAEEKGDHDKASRPPSSIIVGLSVALGYLIGGSLPLFPYFIVSDVKDGLIWSFVVCIIVLFSFGFAKDFILHSEHGKQQILRMKTKPSNTCKEMRITTWADIKRSAWEGLLMVMLGSMASLAAVLCVKLFESIAHKEPQV